MKKLAIAVIPALTLTFAAVSGAQAQQVFCDSKENMEAFLQDELGEAPTGEKGSTPVFDMEIYADSSDGSWTILGRPNPDSEHVPDDIPEGLACYLGGGDSGYPDEVRQQDWYQQIFTPPAP
jgi:hypothetical protein